METADPAGLKAALASALSEVLQTEEFDLVEDETGALEAMSDQWTLWVEGWPGGVAFVTIDDEPADADAARMREARRRVMGVAVDRALAAVDRDIGGALAAALRSSGDPLSGDLALALDEQSS
ncbi:MAG: hypothetical protein ACRDJW_12500 [Thermomicrobiales bacterium]